MMDIPETKLSKRMKLQDTISSFYPLNRSRVSLIYFQNQLVFMYTVPQPSSPLFSPAQTDRAELHPSNNGSLSALNANNVVAKNGRNRPDRVTSQPHLR
jgi:hypothetical protein